MQSHPQALRDALRPPRAGSADHDRRAMRDALRRISDHYAGQFPALQTAGYARAEDFTAELSTLLTAKNEELTANVLEALFGTSGRLGRLLGIA